MVWFGRRKAVGLLIPFQRTRTHWGRVKRDPALLLSDEPGLHTSARWFSLLAAFETGIAKRTAERLPAGARSGFACRTNRELFSRYQTLRDQQVLVFDGSSFFAARRAEP